MTRKKASVESADVLDAGRIEKVRFDQLAVSPLNVRKNAEVDAGDELVASIKAHGLLQPLVGYVAKSGMALVLIAAGQRRLLALRHIVAPETMIPVRIVDEETAIEVSLAENLERKDMNPADELAAFQALIDTGHYDANRIADRFGFDRRLVRRRLKMAVLAPEILEALRGGAIGLASAEAYAASDDAELQMQVFKEQSRPNAWNAHSPDAIVRAYSCAGIAADSVIGKFIGGIEAYEAAGGSCATDDAFSELFASTTAWSGPRLKDAGIVERLLTAAQAAKQEQVEEIARAKLPFVNGVQWCDAIGNAPKPKKGSDLVLLQAGWDSVGNVHLSADDVAERAAKIAEAGGQVVAVARVGSSGEPEIAERELLVSKTVLELVMPKSERAETASPPTDEERAARARESAVREQMLLKYGRSLIGETPGFGVAGVTVDRYARPKRLTIRLIRLGDENDDVDFSDEWNPTVKAQLLEPFRAYAEAKVDELAARAEQAKEDDARARTAAVEDFDAKLGRLRATPIAAWPPAVTVTIDDYELKILRRDGDPPTLRLEPEDDEPSESDDIEFVLELIRDNAAQAEEYAIAFDETGDVAPAAEPMAADA